MNEHYKYQIIAKDLETKARNTNLRKKEVQFLDDLRSDRNNNNIFYTSQNENIVIEIINNEHILLHDLRDGKIYRKKWYQKMDMPIMAFHKNSSTNDIIYKNSLIY